MNYNIFVRLNGLLLPVQVIHVYCIADSYFKVNTPNLVDYKSVDETVRYAVSTRNLSFYRSMTNTIHII